MAETFSNPHLDSENHEDTQKLMYPRLSIIRDVINNTITNDRLNINDYMR